MPLHTVTVTGGTAREVYGGLTACEAYLLDKIGDGAAAFRSLLAGGDDRKRLLIEATRYIDRQRWQGEANADGGTTLAFPRDALTADGVAISNADQLALVEQAVFELVAILAGDPDVIASADQSVNIKSMGAGSARLEFFGPARLKDGSASKLPTVVQDLIGHWLAGAGGGSVIIGGIATGTDGEPSFDNCDGYEREDPF